MTDPRPATPCRRCGRGYADHEANRRCPDGSGRTWLGKQHKGASQSFSEDEVVWLDTVLKTLQRRGDTKQLATRAEIGTIARKVTVMKAACQRRKESGT